VRGQNWIEKAHQAHEHQFDFFKAKY